MDEFDDWPISDEELTEIVKKELEDPETYNWSDCKRRQSSEANCFICLRKCNKGETQ